MKDKIHRFGMNNTHWHFLIGIFLTLLLATIAKILALSPYFSIIGEMVIAIFIGIIWRATIGLPNTYTKGTTFSSKTLLRLGIVLLGFRLNFFDIFHAGSHIFIIATTSLLFALIVVFLLTKAFKVDTRLGLLTACGTAICGAAAIVAIAPQIKAKDEEIAVGVATVSILGTLFTLLYTLLFPLLGLSANSYGVLSGATLHEVAHVIAAATPGGHDAVDTAVIVKLTRVAMLVPVALIIGFIISFSEKEEHTKRSWRSLPIPWFIFGFIIASSLQSLQVIPSFLIQTFITAAYLFITMAMAGLGLTIQIHAFKRLGLKPFFAALIGSCFLSLLGYLLVIFLGFS